MVNRIYNLFAAIVTAIEKLAERLGLVETAAKKAETITEGIFPVERGGTGKASHTENAVLVGGGGGEVKNIAAGIGALFAEEENGEPRFDLLPVKCGGTDASTPEAALKNLGGVSITKLWENASLGTFAPQTISLPLNDYNAVIITGAYNTYKEIISTQQISIGDTGYLTAAYSYNAGFVLCMKSVGATTDGVTFGDTIQYQSGYSVNNTRLIPYQIFGIKGVS